MLLPEEHKVRDVFDELARAEDTHDDALWADTFTRHFMRAVPSEDTVVDIGCGYGRVVPILRDLGVRREQYLGIDFSSRQIALAKKLHPDLRFEVADVSELGARYPAHFGGFWCAATLMLVPRAKLPATLRSVRASLKHGAPGFVSTPMGDHDGKTRSGITIALYEIPELETLFTDAGFTPELVFSPDDHMILGRFIAS